MAKKSDTTFEIAFFESILKRNPQDTTVVEILGGLYTECGRIAEGLKMDRKMVRLLPKNATAHYNLACSLALSKRKTDALRSLSDAVSLGYDDADWLKQDPDLDALRQHPEFKKLLNHLQPKS